MLNREEGNPKEDVGWRRWPVFLLPVQCREEEEVWWVHMLNEEGGVRRCELLFFTCDLYLPTPPCGAVLRLLGGGHVLLPHTHPTGLLSFPLVVWGVFLGKVWN